ncbi:ABC transporter substrate-binding protein [Ruminiclostridium cellobioparum]|uniref:ABC transporter substrate-binding protein n=1 Tax=Ruminiclostridium cellobioparum TaxID=29355 RepID=UPI0028A9288D|nr:ABC transporter substrate-binding protein [Ruminiclostridium cellobioparum]
MRKVHEKSIILGIGIGMVITSVAGLIYSGGDGTRSDAKDLSREEIVRLAKGYGMVEPVRLVEDAAAATQTGNPAPDNISSKSTGADSQNSAAAQQTDETGEPEIQTPAEPDAEGKNITVEIKRGYNSTMVAQLLYDKGVISDMKKFVDTMAAYSATKKINIGTYTFKKNDDYVHIVKVICSL